MGFLVQRSRNGTGATEHKETGVFLAVAPSQPICVELDDLAPVSPIVR